MLDAKPVQPGPEQEELDEAGNLDIKTARGLLGSLILSPEGDAAVTKALSSSNPSKMLAMYLLQGIEMVQRRSMGTDTPLDPRIWLASGGVVDELMPIIAEIAADAGIRLPISEILPSVKEQLAQMLQQRGDQLKQEFQGQQQPPQGQPAMSARPVQGGPQQ